MEVILEPESAFVLSHEVNLGPYNYIDVYIGFYICFIDKMFFELVDIKHYVKQLLRNSRANFSMIYNCWRTNHLG